jgi:hypothetical protein
MMTHDWIGFDTYMVYRRPAVEMTFRRDFDPRVHKLSTAAVIYWDYVAWCGNRV